MYIWVWKSFRGSGEGMGLLMAYWGQKGHTSWGPPSACRQFPAESLFQVSWIPSQSCVFVRTWENPLKIAENRADNKMKPSKTEGWRIRKDGHFLADFLAGFIERVRSYRVPKILLIGLRSCAMLCPLALKFNLKDWGCLLVMTWIPISSYNITLKPHQCASTWALNERMSHVITGAGK